jgi:hypothetical protein
VLLETFVDPTRFTGASYQAANWPALTHVPNTQEMPGTYGVSEKLLSHKSVDSSNSRWQNSP